MIVFLNDRYVGMEEARVSPEDRGFLFGDGVYEVMRSYGGELFRVADHCGRMLRSLEAVRIGGFAADYFERVARGLIEKNGLAEVDATVYLQVTRGASPRRQAFPDPPVQPTVYGYAIALKPRRTRFADGYRAVLVRDNRWDRCDIKSVSLLANVLANQEAVEKDADEALFVREGVVTEGSVSNFFGVVNGVVRTHPANHRILHGVTRKVVLELCEAENIPCEENPVREGDLESLEEAFAVSTTIEVMPVLQIATHRVGCGQVGPVVMRLRAAFRELARGEAGGRTLRRC